MPDDLIRKAKIESAKRDLSISALIRAALERELRSSDESIKAGRRFLRLAKKHPVQMPDQRWKREDLYE